MIQYLSDLLKNSLNEKIIELGLSDVFVERLVPSIGAENVTDIEELLSIIVGV